MSRTLIDMAVGTYATSLRPFERARPLFDAAYYAISNPDVLAEGIDPYEHFMMYGWREGRNPSADFNTLFYKDTYPACGSEQNPLLHALSLDTPPRATPQTEDQFLDVQGRVVAPFFDEVFYLAGCKESLNETPLRHYLRKGWREGREPNAGFSSALYLTGASYVRALGVSPFYHLASTKPEAAKACFETKLEQDPLKPISEYYVIQTIRPEFDSVFYLKTNPDVQGSAQIPILHFIRFGWKEGRDPCRDFSVRYYLAENEDVRQSGLNPYYHYIKNGRHEGRRALSREGSTRALFDEEFYLKSYPDVPNAKLDPYEHFMRYGWKEGRNPSQKFNTLYFRDHDRSVDDGSNPFVRFAEGSDHSRGVPSSQAEFIAIQRRVTAPYFDEEFYVETYNLPDGSDPLNHYLTLGWKHGYEPNRHFSTPTYLRARPHAEKLGVSALYHCASLAPQLATLLSSGAKPELEESVDLSELAFLSDGEEAVIEVIEKEFDAKYYLKCNGDVKTSGAAAIVHFVRYGWREGRNPNSLFDTSYYLATNDDVRSAGINPFFHYLTRGRAEGHKPNPAGNSLWPATKAPADADWSNAKAAAGLARAEVVVIIPVYSGFADTLAAIYAVLTNAQKVPFALLVINDQSPDADLTAALRGLAEKGLFVYWENETNLGFVKTCNRGIAGCDTDVVLLNADAVVHNDWLDRLLWHAREDATVATVTPMSNNASLCSYPRANHNNVIALETDGRSIDSMASVCNRRSSVEVPTGVGFCMYMRRSVIKDIGALDEAAFGRGYGEENDFCMRALKGGYKNLFAQDVYVYHAGEVSLGVFRDQEFESGQGALQSKHPDYLGRCRRFIEADPGQEARLRLDLMRLARVLKRRAFVFVTHSLEGGVGTHVEDMATRIEAEGSPVVFIKVGVEGAHGIFINANKPFDIYMPSLGNIPVSKFRILLRDFLIWLQPRLIHVHSFAGMSWQETLGLASVIKSSNQPYAYTLHDYSTVCHRNHLVRPDATFCGLPSAAVCNKCINSDREFREYADAEARRRFFGSFLRSAKMVIAPSLDVKSRVEKVFENLEAQLRYHDEKPRPVTRPRQPDKPTPLRVAIIGAIGPNKGSSLIHAMALDALTRGLALEFTIIGYSDMTEAMAKVGVVETGRYDSDRQVFDELKKAQPHLVFFSSIWPETYSYTLSLAIAAGVPPVALDIGAPAERLRRYKIGQVLPLELARYPQSLNDALLQIPLDALWARADSAQLERYPSIHKDYYGMALTRSPDSEGERRREANAASIAFLGASPSLALS